MEWLKDKMLVADRFEELLADARSGAAILSMSRMNLGEVFYSSAKEWGIPRAEEIAFRMISLPILFVGVTDEAVETAARLKAVYPISYADAFAAGLAVENRCRLVTGDKDFRVIEAAGLLRLEWLGA